MDAMRQHSRFFCKAAVIAVAVSFACLSIATAHAGIYSTGDVAPDPFSFGDTTLSVALSVGNTFPGGVTIEEGSTLTTLGGAFIGNLALGTMEVLGTWVDGVDSFINIGHVSTGELIVRPNGTLNGNRVRLGVIADSMGTATVLGTLNAVSDIFIGDGGTGSLTIEAGGVVSNDNGFIGYQADSNGSVMVRDAGSSWTNSDRLFVGLNGNAILNVENGGVVNSTDIDGNVIGSNEGSNGSVTVTGAGSTWTSSSVVVGSQGTAILTIENGGAVSSSGSSINDSAYVGLNEGSYGIVTVTGAGSTWSCTPRPINVGVRSVGNLTIADGGVVSSDGGIVGQGSTSSDGTVTVTGAGSTWNIVNEWGYGIQVGNLGGKGSLTIADSGVLNNDLGGILGVSAGSNGSASVTGTGSSWTNSSSLIVGNEAASSGSLTIENGGGVQASQVFVGLREDSMGVLVVKNATLDAGIRLGIGFNFSQIGGRASARLVNGTVIANDIFIGTNGKLFGTGTITGNVNLEDGGRLSPGLSPGQMIIDGDFNLTNGLLELEADSPSLKDELVISGNLSIGPEAIINIVLGFELTDAFDIGDFFFDVSGSFTVDPDFQADQINLYFTADSGMTIGEAVEIMLGGSLFSVIAMAAPPACECDLEPAEGDGDVDGADLAAYMVYSAGITLSDFAAEFGKTNCQN